MTPEKIAFECARPIERDADLVMKWRNDPETLRMSFHSHPKRRKEFLLEFKNEYFDLPELPPLFILYEGQRVGFVRFRFLTSPIHPQRRCCDMSIMMAAEYRHKGIGKISLKELNAWVSEKGFDDIVAEIKKENIASKKAFEQAGYRYFETKIKTLENGTRHEFYRYVSQLTPNTSMLKKGVFIIAEAGSNWRMGTPSRDLAMAKTLASMAVEAGADAIKFQTFRPETVYASNAGQANYLAEAGIQEDIEEIFEDLSMPYEMIPILTEHCRKLGIQFMSTPFSRIDFKAVDPFVERHKIASYEINHIRLIELAAHSKKPLYLSTGASTEDEIQWALQTYYNYGGNDVTLLQCTAQYPAEVGSLNLKAIPWMKSRYKVAVGLSDHSRHPTSAPIAAVALGATVIEKHFTLDNHLPGPDHAFAITPSELKEMVQAIRRVEQMLGSPQKTVYPSEGELRSFSKRGIQALKKIQKGEILKEGVNIDILRPGKNTIGLNPKFIIEIEGKKALRNIEIGEGIQQGDWE